MPPRGKKNASQGAENTRTAAKGKGKQRAPSGEKSAAEKKQDRNEHAASAKAVRNANAANARKLSSKLPDTPDDNDENEDGIEEEEEDEEEEEEEEENPDKGDWGGGSLGIKEEELLPDDDEAESPENSEEEDVDMPAIEVDDDSPPPMSPPRRAHKRTDSMRSPKSIGKKRQCQEHTPAPSGNTASTPHRTPARRTCRVTPGTPSPAVPQPLALVPQQRTGGCKISKANWDDTGNKLVEGAKAAFRAHGILYNAFPPEHVKKAPYYKPILKEYVYSDFAAANLRDIYEEVCEDKEMLENLCVNGAYAVADGVKKFCEWSRLKPDFFIPGKAKDTEKQDLVAWHNKTLAFLYGTFDAEDRTVDETTAFEAAWAVGDLRRFAFDGGSKLDNYAIHPIHKNGGPTQCMWALIHAGMLHCIMNVQTGRHIPTKFGGAVAQDEYHQVLAVFSVMEKKVPGWFDTVSDAVYHEAGKQANKEWQIKEFADRQETRSIDYSRIQEKVDQRKREKAEQESKAKYARLRARVAHSEASVPSQAGSSSAQAGSSSAHAGSSSSHAASSDS